MTSRRILRPQPDIMMSKTMDNRSENTPLVLEDEEPLEFRVFKESRETEKQIQLARANIQKTRQEIKESILESQHKINKYESFIKEQQDKIKSRVEQELRANHFRV